MYQLTVKKYTLALGAFLLYFLMLFPAQIFHWTLDKPLEEMINESHPMIDLCDLPGGFYLFRISSEKEAATGKFLNRYLYKAAMSLAFMYILFVRNSFMGPVSWLIILSVLIS